MQKSKDEIVDYVVEHFSNNPRSISGNGKCLYNGPSGSCCAFALCVNEDDRDQLLEYNAASYQLMKFGDKILKDEFKGHGPGFWDSVQDLHDSSANWSGNELTETGEKAVARIKRIHCN
jgi:hypothetical protein